MEIRVKGGELPEEEIRAYVEYVKEKNPGREIETLTLAPDGEMVDLEYRLCGVPFERIRRITGYLVGTLERWNDAKRAEERDRVKHA